MSFSLSFWRHVFQLFNKCAFMFTT